MDHEPTGAETGRLRAIRQLTRAVARAEPDERLLGLALDMLLRLTQADAAAIELRDASGPLRLQAWQGMDASILLGLEGRGPWAQDPSEILLVEDVAADPSQLGIRDELSRAGMRSLTLLPIAAEETTGRVTLFRHAPGVPSDHDLEFATTVAQVLAAQRPPPSATTIPSGEVLQRLGEGVVITDRAGRLVYTNDMADDLLGRKSCGLPQMLSEVLASIDVLDLDGFPVAREELPERIALQTGQTASAILRLVPVGGVDEHWTAVTSSAIPDARGRPVLAVSVLRDITFVRRAQEQLEENERRLREALDTAREAEKRKDEFLAVLGHELRNPLAPIVTALQVMDLKGYEGEHERRLIERHVSYLRRLVDDLLDLSRITRGKITLQRKRVELADVVSEAVELVAPLLEERRHGLSVEVPMRGMQVIADPTRLAQVVVNLLTNAARYTDPGGHVVVEGRVLDRWAQLTVRDDGIGISSDILPELFEYFVQGTRTLEQSRGGLGLGLTIVRQMIELHGGEVDVRSDGPGKGSEFIVRLPLATEPSQPTPETSRRPPLPQGASLRILVVDDNVDAAETVADALALLGHRTRTAHDGPSALQLVRRHGFDVAVLDIGLPVMDGFELARRIREVHPRIRLIAVTGYGQPHDRRRSAESGFARHLVKPVGLDSLVSAIVNS